jgi:hypothetical protein
VELGGELATPGGTALTLDERKVIVEEGKLQVEKDKLAFEKSLRKVLGAGVLAALVALAVAGVGLWQNRLAEADRKAQASMVQKQQDGLWGVQVLELYVTHAGEFDPVKSPETAGQNLSALVAAAPDLMRPILERRKDSSVRVGIADDPASALSVAAIQQALGPPPVTTPPADAGLPSGVNPAAYSVYIQYGNAAGHFASKYGAELSGIGFQVPPLEQVPAPPDVPEVRYYLPGQQPLAEWLTKRLDEQAPQRQAAITKLIGSGDLPGGIIEVWIPSGWN